MWKEGEAGRIGRGRNQTVIRAWPRLGQAHRELWREHTCLLSQWPHGGVRPLNLFVTHYLVWALLEKMSPWAGWLSAIGGTRRVLVVHHSDLTLSELIGQVAIIIELTSQAVVIIRWIIVQNVFRTGVGDTEEALGIHYWGRWYWGQCLELFSQQDSWSSPNSGVSNVLHVSESLGGLVQTQA